MDLIQSFACGTVWVNLWQMPAPGSQATLVWNLEQRLIKEQLRGAEMEVLFLHSRQNQIESSRKGGVEPGTQAELMFPSYQLSSGNSGLALVLESSGPIPSIYLLIENTML
jgi:hypothetical protein